MSRDQGPMWKFLQDVARSRCIMFSTRQVSRARRRTASPIRRASEVLIWLSRLGSPIFWAGCPGWRTAARSFSASALPKPQAMSSTTTTVKLDRLMERERRRRCLSRAEPRHGYLPLSFLPRQVDTLDKTESGVRFLVPPRSDDYVVGAVAPLVCLRSETAVCVSLATLHRATGKQTAGKLSVSQRG